MRDLEVEVLEDGHGGPGRVAEGEVFETDGPARGGHGQASGGGDGGVAVLELEETGSGADALHELGVEGGEAEEGGSRVGGIHEEGGKLANTDASGLDHAATYV